MKEIKKVLKRGEYFQTFELLLEAHYEQNGNRWVYDTNYRKNDKDSWKPFNADEKKIIPIVNGYINNQIETILNYSIVKLVK